MLLRARMNAKRNSAGMSGGRSVGVSSSSGPRVGVSDSVSGVGAGSAGAGLNNAGILIFGIGIVIRGFFVRTISVVVATYNGNAARIKMPNTKPGKPRNWARIKCRHWGALNIEKSNMKNKIAHVIAT